MINNLINDNVPTIARIPLRIASTGAANYLLGGPLGFIGGVAYGAIRIAVSATIAKGVVLGGMDQKIEKDSAGHFMLKVATVVVSLFASVKLAELCGVGLTIKSAAILGVASMGVTIGVVAVGLSLIGAYNYFNEPGAREIPEDLIRV